MCDPPGGATVSKQQRITTEVDSAGEAQAMRLGIDYGTVTTRAVLAWPDGRWTRLLFDGAPQLPSGVYLEVVTPTTLR